MKFFSRVACILTSTLFVSACGGGGGGTSMPAPVTVTGTNVSWAADNRAKTTTTSFSDGTKTATTVDVPPVVAGGVLSIQNGTNFTSPIVNTYGNGVTEVLFDGSVQKPFLQTALTTTSNVDPNGVVQTSTRSIDLRWGTKASPYVLPQTDNVQASLATTTGRLELTRSAGSTYSPITFPFATSFSSPLDQSTALLQGVWITPDVKAAWAQGWTGAGKRIGVIDDFTANDVSDFLTIPIAPSSCSAVGALVLCGTSATALFQQTHGDQVAMIAGGGRSSLPGFFVEIGTYANSTRSDRGTYILASDLNIRLSSPQFGVAKDATVLRDDFLTYQSSTNGLFSVLKNWGVGNDAASSSYRSLSVVNLSLGGTSRNAVSNKAVYSTQLSFANSSVVPDAVFVKAAGNSTCVVSQTNCDPLNAVFYNSSQFKDKSILVGALAQAGGSIASYSNTAGSFADRFVVADGRGVREQDGSYVQGTSFAAPRVAGYAAILRQKFPNLTAPSTVNVILDTATWNPVWGAKDATTQGIYGQGEANLGRALAPVGSLR